MIIVWLTRFRDELLKHYPNTWSSRNTIMREYEKILKEIEADETCSDEKR